MTDGANPTEALREDFTAGRIDRRGLLHRAAALGLSGSALGTLLAACGGKSTTAGRKSTVLRFGRTGRRSVFDPAFDEDGYGWSLDGIFEGLQAYKPGVKGFVKENVLAEKVDVSSDGKQIVFELKKGVPFQKGFGEVTAEDVKYSFERIAGIEKIYPDAKKNEAASYQADWQQLDQVRVTGRYSGVIVLKSPSSSVINGVLPYVYSGYIVSKKAVEKYGKNGFPSHPIGSGAYELASYEPKKQWTLKRVDKWDHHWQRPVELEAVEYTFGDAGAAGQAATVPLEAGEVDFDAFPSFLDYQRLRNSNDIRGYVTPSLGYEAIAMNVQNPKLQDVRVREAIRYTVDVPAILDAAHMTEADRAYALVSRAFGEAYWSDAPHYNRDVAKAKALMNAAGMSSLTLQIDSEFMYPPIPGAFEIVQSNLADIGVNATSLSQTPDSWYSDPKAPELWMFGYAGVPDVWYQFAWWTCDQVGVYNLPEWCDSTYSTLVQKLGATRDPAVRATISIEAQKLMDRAAAFVWLFYPKYYFLCSTKFMPALDENGGVYPTWFKAV